MGPHTHTAGQLDALIEAYRSEATTLADLRTRIAVQEEAIAFLTEKVAGELLATVNERTNKPHSWTSAQEAAFTDARLIKARVLLLDLRTDAAMAEVRTRIARWQVEWALTDTA